MSENCRSGGESSNDKTCCCGGKASETPLKTNHVSGSAHRFRIAEMDCPTEEGEIRRALANVAGIRSLTFLLAERTLVIDADADVLERAQAAIRKLGFHPVVITPDEDDAHVADAMSNRISDTLRLGNSLAAATVAEVISIAAPQYQVFGMVMAALAIALAGFSVYIKGLTALLQGRLNVSALMAVAVTGAFLIGEWPEAAMVMALYAIAEVIEVRAVDRARNAINSLMSLAPEETDVLQPDGGWRRMLCAEVSVGSTVRIRPGERVPLDGVITVGASAIDQAPVTGESMPVDKTTGDEVYAGTINQIAELEIRVTALASDSTVARIIHAVEQAQASRAPMQRFVDRFSAVYTPAVFVLAVVVALVTPFALGLTWLQALYKALVLLVIACPCALVISTPVTVVSGLAAAARRGILVKGGVYLEEARKLKAVALDKTGTVTEGRPKLVAFEPVDKDGKPGKLKRLARSLASRSDHPVSKAIAAGINEEPLDVEGFEAAAGRGVKGRINDRVYALANHRWIEERSQCSPELEARLAQHEQVGWTVTLLADEKRVLAICAVADTIRPTSAAAVAELKALGVVPIMITGDNAATARAVAAQAGIDEARGNLLPEDKLRAIEEMQKRYGPTAMAGDGINDAPALAKAEIGFAMGGAGTHTAMETADVVVMNDDLRRLAETIRLSRRTHAVLWQNITLALGIKAVFMLLAIFDNATMWMAVFADMGASLLVVGNGLRLLKVRPT